MRHECLLHRIGAELGTLLCRNWAIKRDWAVKIKTRKVDGEEEGGALLACSIEEGASVRVTSLFYDSS